MTAQAINYEIQRGSNPQIANLSELKVCFLQNYKIKVAYTKKDDRTLSWAS